MKKACSLICLLFICKFSFSQIIITATSGTTGPTPYITLQSAFDAVNAGTHTGIITIIVNGNTTETATAILNASGSGASSYTTVTIKPGAAVMISGNIAGTLIDLNGADNVTIDGLNNGDASLTISNISATAAAGTLRFINDATANIVRNVTITGSGTSSVSGTVFFSTGTTTGNDNNQVINCSISDASGNFPANAIYSFGNGSVGQGNNSILINNNNISNFFSPGLNSVGIRVSAGNTDWVISANRFFQTAARTFVTNTLVHRAIQVSSGENYTITGNTIGYATAAGTGIYTLNGAVTSSFIAIDLAVGTNTVSNVNNNTIANISFLTSASFNSGSGIWCGINITSGNVDVGSASGNTIGSTSGTGAIVINPTVAGTLSVGITSSGTGNVIIANNRIGAIDVLPSGVLSGNLTGIQTQGTGGTILIFNNAIGNPTAHNLRVGVLGTTTGNGIIRGINNSNTGTVNILQNTVQNLTHYSNNAVSLFRAIECQQGVASITLNNIRNVTANGTSTSVLTVEGAGILATTGGANLEIDQNTISNLNVINSTTASGIVVIGIYLGSGVNGANITRNKIYGFTNASTSVSPTSPGVIAGIYCRDAAVANPNILVANNMISFGNAQATNSALIGIWNLTASANGLTTSVYYNSINIEGTVATGAQPSFCYYRGDFSATTFTTPTIDIKNNIFNNSRSGGTGKHYAIANNYGAATSSAGGWGANASDYNVLNANPSTVGYWSGDRAFAGWQAASAGDVNSLTGLNLIFLNPASGDLHLTNTVNIVVDGKAMPLPTITSDFDNDTRNATTPDIGADEFNASALPIIIEYFTGNRQGSINVLNWKAACSATMVTFNIERSNDGRIFSSIGKTTVTQSRCTLPFTITDKTPLTGINYYRLKTTEADGTVSYSAIITLLNRESGFEVVSLTPTIVNKMMELHVLSAKTIGLTITITDINGRTVQQQAATAMTGSGTITIDAGNLTNGNYQLTCLTNDGKIKTIRFIKR